MTRPRLKVLPGIPAEDPYVDCKDRSIGHQWRGNARWVDGPTRKVGRRSEYVTYRVSRCPACTTERKEVYVQVADRDDIVRSMEKTGNRYKHPKDWRASGRLTQGEIHAQQYRRSRRAV